MDELERALLAEYAAAVACLPADMREQHRTCEETHRAYQKVRADLSQRRFVSLDLMRELHRREEELFGLVCQLTDLGYGAQARQHSGGERPLGE